MASVIRSSVLGPVIAMAVPILLCSCSQHEETPKEVSQKTTPAIAEVPVVQAQKLELRRQINLPGEISAYRDIPIHAKVQGFVKWIGVDRGSKVNEGDVIIKISAPELDARVSEFAAKVEKAKSALAQAKSKLSTAIANQKEGEANRSSGEAVYMRLKKASGTPGVISENELDIAAKKLEADKDHVEALKEAIDSAKAEVAAAESELHAARESLASVKDLEEYLTVKAPFHGVITARNVHEGSLVSPSDIPMVQCQQISTLRVVVPVPEIAVSGLKLGTKVPFTVPAQPGRTFYGTLARLGHALDQKTRTMPVELDYQNSEGLLEPGMYPQVAWTVERPYLTTFVPASAVGRSLAATYVDVVKDNKIHVVPVSTGQPMGEKIEVFGEITPQDTVTVKASDDLKDGTEIQPKLVSQSALAAKSE